MRLNNVIEISDNGEFVTIVTASNSAIHLPTGPGHSITIHTIREADKSLMVDGFVKVIQQDVSIDLFQS